MRKLSSEEGRAKGSLEQLKDKLPPPAPEEEPPPPEETVEEAEPEPVEAEPAEAEAEEVEYLEELEEEPERPRKPPRRHYGAFIALVIVVLILLLWTLLSPKLLPESGEVYLRSPTYANLGNYTGDRDIWAGKMTWGLSFSGSAQASVGQPEEYTILVTKVSEEPGNFWLQGTSIKIQNVSIFNEDGTLLASTKKGTDMGFGISSTLSVSFSAPGSYQLYAYVKFLVYEVMRVGFIPLESVQISEAYFDVQIVAT